MKIRKIAKQVLAIAIVQFVVAGCSNTPSPQQENQKQQVESLADKNSVKYLLNTHKDKNTVHINFKGYKLKYETVLDNGVEITYTTGIEQEPAENIDVYASYNKDGLVFLREANGAYGGSNLYFLSNNNKKQAISYGCIVGDTPSIGVYLGDDYVKAESLYSCGILSGEYTIESTQYNNQSTQDNTQNTQDNTQSTQESTQDNTQNTQDNTQSTQESTTSIKDSQGNVYNAVMDSDGFISKLIQDSGYSLPSQEYTVELQEEKMNTPSWVDDIGKDKETIECKVIYNGKTYKFNTYRGVKTFICVGDNISIESNNPVNIADTGVAQSIIENNTDFYVLESTEFTVTSIKSQ